MTDEQFKELCEKIDDAVNSLRSEMAICTVWMFALLCLAALGFWMMR